MNGELCIGHRNFKISFNLKRMEHFAFFLDKDLRKNSGDPGGPSEPSTIILGLAWANPKPEQPLLGP